MLGRRIVALAIGLALTPWLPGQAASSANDVKDTKAAAVSGYPLDSLTEFSATQVGSIVGNIDEIPIYRSGKLMRTGMLDGNYMVSDFSTLDTYIVMPKRCVHTDKLPTAAFPFTPRASAMASDRTYLRDEVWAGHQCRVESIKLNAKEGGGTQMRLWEAKDLQGFPLKVEVDRGSRVITIEYKDVKLVRPDPAVFKHPLKCGAPPGKEN